ncbi:hypothetical protein OV090_18425 [Nannocystis sp. RBIL2]|uniref:hypothetical protein n=1 Tax=Nannocystis sp. RBIL2 TaxID=2996788 RepID=UPI00226DCF14|nr:hypothetical protein [Nannocystis sp. RBIL2]MCY1066757.1 hypothetical protein [Nannocystis sp. RBIL2]
MHHPKILRRSAPRGPGRSLRPTLAKWFRRVAHLAAAALLRRVLQHLLNLFL